MCCFDQQAVILHAAATCTCPHTPPLTLQHHLLCTAMQLAVCWSCTCLCYAEKLILNPMGSDLSVIRQLDILLSHAVICLLPGLCMVEHLRSDNNTIRQQQHRLDRPSICQLKHICYMSPIVIYPIGNSPCVCNRWCVTGTPVGSDIADLKGQFNFLQLHPFTNKNFFSVYVKPAYTGSTWARPPASMLLCVLSQCMIRHTKLQVTLAMTPTPTMTPIPAMDPTPATDPCRFDDTAPWHTLWSATNVSSEHGLL